MPREYTRRKAIVTGGTTLLVLTSPGAVTGEEDVYTDAEELAPPPELFGPEWQIAEESPEEAEDAEEEDTNDEFDVGSDDDDVFDVGSDDDGEDELDVEVQDEYSREYESEEGYARVDTIVYGEDDDLDGAFENATDGFLITGEPIDIGDEAIYDEIDPFALVLFRDRNAIAIVMAGQIIGLCPTPDRTTAIGGADTLIDYWHEEVL